MRQPSILTSIALAAVVALGTLAPQGARAQTPPTPLTCTVNVVNVVGAHAGTLALRVGADAACGEPVSLEFTLPGGARSTFPSTATGTFTGIVGEGYVCAGKDDRVAVLATGAGGRSWLGLVTIGPEFGAPPVPAGTMGRACDVLLGPGLNYLNWGGPVSRVESAFAAGRFGAVIPRGHRDERGRARPDHLGVGVRLRGRSVGDVDPGCARGRKHAPRAEARTRLRGAVERGHRVPAPATLVGLHSGA
ncbi:MAG: hypothetical protein U0360_04335 [Dehalococcoidia bacterium]